MLKKRVSKEKVNYFAEAKGKTGNDSPEITKTMVTGKGERKIGLAKTFTKNMGNYQSAKIGVWMERVVPDNDHDCTINLQEMSKYLDDWLQSEIEELE